MPVIVLPQPPRQVPQTISCPSACHDDVCLYVGPTIGEQLPLYLCNPHLKTLSDVRVLGSGLYLGSVAPSPTGTSAKVIPNVAPRSCQLIEVRDINLEGEFLDCLRIGFAEGQIERRGKVYIRDLFGRSRPIPISFDAGGSIAQTKSGARPMSQLNPIQVNRLTSDKISIRAQTDYREVGSMEPILRCLQSGSGIMHLAPIGSGQLEAEDLKRFHALPGRLQRFMDAPNLKAFWLVAHWRDRSIVVGDPHRDDAGSSQQSLTSEESFDAVVYSWLFIQPRAISDPAWQHACEAISKTTGQTAICRSRGEASVLVYAEREERSSLDKAAKEVLQAVAANAMPVSWGFGAQRCSISGPEPTVGRPSLYAAVPHCNSSRMMFAYRGILKGSE